MRMRIARHGMRHEHGLWDWHGLCSFCSFPMFLICIVELLRASGETQEHHFYKDLRRSSAHAPPTAHVRRGLIQIAPHIVITSWFSSPLIVVVSPAVVPPQTNNRIHNHRLALRSTTKAPSSSLLFCIAITTILIRQPWAVYFVGTLAFKQIHARRHVELGHYTPTSSLAQEGTKESLHAPPRSSQPASGAHYPSRPSQTSPRACPGHPATSSFSGDRPSHPRLATLALVGFPTSPRPFIPFDFSTPVFNSSVSQRPLLYPSHRQLVYPPTQQTTQWRESSCSLTERLGSNRPLPFHWDH
jgi:hypothetical protein